MSRTKTLKYTHNEYLDKVYELNQAYREGRFEIIGKYEGIESKMFTQDAFGICCINAGSLFWGMCPTINSAIDKTSYYINKAKEVHGDKYDYSLVNYDCSSKKVLIICPLHNEFSQVPHAHLRGSGCPLCAIEFNIYKKQDWIEAGGERPGIFYILKCWNEHENFYKVGLTCETIKKRYHSSYKMPYIYEILKEVRDFNKERIWDMEKEYIKKLKEYHYTPKIKFPGSVYECFSHIPEELLK